LNMVVELYNCTLAIETATWLHDGGWWYIMERAFGCFWSCAFHIFIICSCRFALQIY
jgi:hypothetical protein